MRELSDETLQDYVDGRLSERERAEVESRLREDANLAQRVAAWEEIGRALRAGDAELPDGFYARARERFVRETAPQRWVLRRLLSWEAAGLAAAAILAVLLFAPELTWQRSTDRPARRTPPPEPAPEIARLRSAEAEPGTPAAQPEGPPPRDAEAPRVSATDALEDDARAGKLDRPAPAPTADFAPPPPSSGLAQDAVDRRELDGSRAPAQSGKRREAAPAPRPGAPEAPPEAYAGGALAEERASAPATSPLAGSPREVAGAEAIALGPVAALPGDVVAPGELGVVDTEEAWRRWLSGPARAALTPLGAPDPGRRLVLFGASATDCGALTVTRGVAGYRVWPRSGGASAGCAFLLPRDGLPVELERSGP